MENSKSLMGRMWVLVALVVAGVLCFGLTACGKTSEEIIREGLAEKFDALKHLDEETFENVLGDYEGSEYFEVLGIDYATFCATWFEGFDYEIGDVVIDNDKATADVTVSIKSLSEASKAYENEIEKMVESGKYGDLTEDELYKKFGAAFLDCVKDAKITSTTVKIPYVLNNGKWEPGEGFSEALNEAFVGASF